MDSLTYNYFPGTNQLKFVRDSVPDNIYSLATADLEDIDNQTTSPSFPSNYTYTEIGDLKTDRKDSIKLIKWNVYGKITEIQRNPSTARPISKINYTYDAAGNRISKKIERSTDNNHEYTWYVRDASGNVMATYYSIGARSNSPLSSNYNLLLKELDIYGSSRVGLINRNVDVKTAFVNPQITTFERGNKFFELTNHLGNVLATISDKKIPHSTDGTTIDYYDADVVTANDYYPFGSLMPGRKYAAGSSYRYGFNGKENDNNINGEGNEQDYGMRIYDTRLGRFLSVDPLDEEYPELTPYQFASCNPITFIDRDGEEAAYKMPDGSIYMQPPSDHMIVPIPQSVRDNSIPLNNSKPLSPNAFDRFLSTALDFVPYVGEVKMAAEFGLGMDVVTGESSPRMASLPIIKEVRNVNKLVKAEEELNKIAKSQKAVTKSEQTISNTENSIITTNPEITRVKPRKNTLEIVKENQPKNENGKMIDPNTKQVLKKGKIDLGHKTGQEWSKRKKMHEANGSTRKQVIEAENDPNLYHFEDRSSNRSRKFEQKKGD